MDKIKNKGITLIELILYMSIFSIMFLIINSTIFYLQRIIENNNQNYYVKNQIYYNLNILQQYLYKTYIKIENNNLSFFDKNNNLVLLQKIENNQILNVYKDKTFNMTNNINVSDFKADLSENNTLLTIEISWIDNNKKIQKIKEYLIVINRNM